MATINIQGTTPVDDPEYRYKMPKVIGKVEGRGNGIKTVIANITELATSLHRDPAEVTKFFGTELGAQTKWNAEDERAIVNGQHTDPQLQNLVFRYCEFFVLCPTCRLPETDYKIKNGAIFHKCHACGSKEMVDMAHKLTTFILNQHKKSKDSKSKKDKDKDKKKKKKKKSEDDEKDEDSPTKDDGEKKEKKSKKKKKEKEKSRSSDGSASDDGSDKSAEDIATMIGNVTLEEAEQFDSAVESIQRVIATGASVEAVLEELRVVQTFSSFPTYFRIDMMVAAAFGSGNVTANELAPHKEAFVALVNGNQINERRVIGALERLCGQRRPELQVLFPVILKMFYDEDIVSEEVILDWGAEMDLRTEYSPEIVTDETLEALQNAAKPFLTWLEEADEDDSDEEEDA
mmetsp:Transcript_22062/g.32024  ORF Transcript_22062/g.32024 Transcript_22062/m.32024 type:complete len:403 (-) Transcript_22062:197-1405(-)|eukprot:CAMPEP_0113938064 /NCGR_PEP_ID=MMETSP1339-20121228/4486_1 /TAXON_ID=94617 /ORGANISM="Fibrocapsa japonica" /LENGTH=402 /DNA_ID=CAMNT_0000940999 /DNA_START=142 /DNA_END=1350 /DNA_ORIENTATION=- /assembly_acc=CAM_ASM_000762